MKYTVEKANKFIAANKNNVNEKHRHKLHLMPEIGWMNDPNGLIFYKGEYHAFYQHYPYESIWGPMHWGHAKSKDLYNWQHLPIALAPDLEREHGCFSGGSVVVQDNLYLLYTSHFNNGKQLQEQSVAKSTDGIIFSKNPVPFLSISDLPDNASKVDFRDPNAAIIDNQKFLLVGSTNDEKQGQFLVYKTSDFNKYEYLNKIEFPPLFGEMAECPDLFELDNKHVLLFSGTNIKTDNNRFKNINSSLYAIGNFDTNTGEFEIENIDEIDLGHHFYAPQTFLNDNNERIMMAWMNMWDKEYFTAINAHNWTGALTFPRKLKLLNNQLIQEPYKVEDIFKTKTNDLNNLSKTFRFKVNIDLNSGSIIKFGNNDNYFSLEVNKKQIVLNTNHTKLYPLDSRYIEIKDLNQIEIELFMDVSSVEVFVKDIDKTITTLVYFDEEVIKINIDEAKDNIIDLNIWE